MANDQHLDDSTGFFTRAVLYPDHYCWFVFASAMDLLMTGVVLYHGGWEMNRLAEFVILRFGRFGLVTFKFVLVALVLIICELVGRRRPELGRRLATWAILIPAIAVAAAFVQLLLVGV